MSLEIIGGRLHQHGRASRFVRAASHSGPMTAPPQAIVLHYGGGTQAGDIATLTRGYVSAHFSLGTQGRIVQMLPTHHVAWHAGDGHLPGIDYHGRTLNYTAVGIELENLGWLNRTDGDDAWREETIAGKTWRSPSVLQDRCIHARHPLRGGDAYWWPLYPEGQLAALYELIAAIVEEHASITHLVGHDEVSPAKYDPGPCLDMDILRMLFDLKGVPAAAPARPGARQAGPEAA